jgi:3-oxoacyl-[acyl-carrier-protein] synthase III
MQQFFKVIGTGHYLPGKLLSADDIDARANLPAGWAANHVGVLSRYECLPPESLGSMAGHAVAAALKDADIDWPQVDLILDASTCRHQPIPCNAAFVQAEIGEPAYGIPCMDVQTTCLGFIAALQIANGLFAAGGYEHIVIVCSEAALAGVNWKDPETACLFGDGAAAAAVRRTEPIGTLFYEHETYSKHIEICGVRGGSHRLPPFYYTPERYADYRFHMDGKSLFKVARKKLLPMTNRLIDTATSDPNTNFTREQLHVIPHQASPLAVEKIRRGLELTHEQYDDRVANLGNMIAASIPTVLSLSRSEGKISQGDPVMLLGTSAGYSQAAMIFQM